MCSLKVIIPIFSILVICEAAMTVDQMKQAAKVARIACMQKVKISEERVNELEKAEFPDDRDLKCYTYCLLEMMNTMKKMKMNYDAAVKQIDLMMPDEQKETVRNALTICRDVPKAYSDTCDAGYAVFECLYKNNQYFFFP